MKQVIVLFALTALFFSAVIPPTFADRRDWDALFSTAPLATARNELRSADRLSELKKELQRTRKELRQTRDGARWLKRIERKKKVRPVILPSSIDPVTAEASVVMHETGQASFYSDSLNGRYTASGEIFSNDRFTAAHKTLAFGTKVKVVNVKSGASVEVVINDRGPYIHGRIIDLTKAAFSQLDQLSKGVIEVRIEVSP